MNLAFVKSPEGADPIVVEGVFKTTAERMFAAWTTPDDLKQWFGPGPGHLDLVDVDLREGGAWRFAYGMRDGQSNELSGAYEVIDAPRKLVFSWIHTRKFADGRAERTDASKVTITFDERADGTLVRLVHEAIKTRDGRLGVRGGWDGGYVRLDDFIANQVAALK
ncbi:MAG: SRPBCC domain-containing protein [Pseudomonadota bacterium]